MVSLKNLNCILLVDDDMIYNFLHKKLINNSGFKNHIEVALNGKSALDYIKDAIQHPNDKNHPIPELVLLDINMPVMDGWEFLDAFNDLNRCDTKDISIVMVTSSIDPDDITKAKKIELIRDFASKPLTIKKIDQIYKTCLIKTGETFL